MDESVADPGVVQGNVEKVLWTLVSVCRSVINDQTAVSQSYISPGVHLTDLTSDSSSRVLCAGLPIQFPL